MAASVKRSCKVQASDGNNAVSLASLGLVVSKGKVSLGGAILKD